MKKYIQTVLVLFGVLLNTSCNDFLDLNPISDHTSDPQNSENITSKYKTVEEAKAELNGAYSKFKQDIYQFEIFCYNDIQSDNCYLGGDGEDGFQLDELRVNSMNSKVAMMWSQYYQMVGTATSVIENTRLMDESLIDDNTRKALIAEAKFIRAYGYFDIVRIWGEAPMVLVLVPSITAGNLEELYPLLYPSKSSIEDIYAQIITDLEEALPILNSKSQGEFKATKGAAHTLLAKVYATKGKKADRNYSKVIEHCDKVIAEGYKLVANYDDLWNPSTKFTSESIFEVSYTALQGNWAYWVLFSESDGSITWRRFCTPTHELLAKFETQDKRLASSVAFKEVPYDTYFPANNYPIANKIRQKDSNIILLRLADVMLLKAEALVELGRSDEAMALVNAIRLRAGITSLSTSMNQADARLAVEKERQLELLLEGHRWFDLLRNDRMLEVMRNHKNKNGKVLYPNIQEFRVLWPVPQAEKDINERLTQNEGY